ncbi:hypothetical protein STSP2_01967 [Anaerohalosphaera lusitana]|uniref:DUF3450 family protein n=1 Tax=Anaerohalosphaera lusitana TaxID=1936003 RepID=A0A1U9NM31_9BACT|nr:DUF3450 family protein [Anaerohalosphaera lusitana]AQT68794.1 hypothetical protein STSP2_01967 [Anaerohalosphaera lusitana]
MKKLLNVKLTYLRDSWKRSASLKWAVILLTPFLLLAGSRSLQAADEVGPQQARLLIEKWVETERLISEEKQKFRLASEMLEERISLVKNEIKSLKDKISETEDSIAEADKKRKEMVEENEKLKETSTFMTDTATDLEGRCKDLIKRLPNPIKDRIRPLSQRLPEDPAKTDLSLSKRFENVIGILNEVDKFNREVTAVSEIRDLTDGSSIEVSTLYLGLGQAWYTNADGDIAGISVPAEDGWQWQQDNTIALNVKEAIAVLNNEKVAEFIELPVKVK